MKCKSSFEENSQENTLAIKDIMKVFIKKKLKKVLKTEIAIKLITMDMGTKDIVQATGLSMEAIELLQKEVKN